MGQRCMIPTRRRAAQGGAVLFCVLALPFLLGACERSKEGGAPPASSDYATPADEPVKEAPPAQSGAGAAAPAAANDLPTIVCFGDSLTAGHGVAESEAWPALLQQRLDAEGYRYRVVNAGVSGDTSAGGVARMDWLLRQRIDILIVELGANDGLRGLDPAETEKNLAAIIEKGRANAAKVVLAGMRMPVNYGADYKRRYDAIFPELAGRYRLPLIPFLLDGVAGRRDLNLPDGIHPAGAGHKVVLENVWAVLKPLLEKR
jgi:acyl-CoA thioesterase-1